MGRSLLGSVSSKRGTSGRATLTWPSSGGAILGLGAVRGTSGPGVSGRGMLVYGTSRGTSGKDTDTTPGVPDTSGVSILMAMSEEEVRSFAAVNEQSAARLHGGPSLRGMNSGMAALVGAPVDGAVLAVSRVVLMISWVGYVPEMAVSVLSVDEVALAELLKVVEQVTQAVVVPSGVGTGSPVSRPKLPDGVVAAFVPAVPVKSGNVSHPAGLTTSLLKVTGTTSLPVSAIVAEAKLSLGTEIVTLIPTESVGATVSTMGMLMLETVSALNSMVLSVLLLVSVVTEVSVVPLSVTLFGVVVEVCSVLTPYIKGVVGVCVSVRAVLAVIILAVASLVVAVPKRLSVEGVAVVSAGELAAAVSLTMSVTPSDEGEGRSDAAGVESSAAVREEKVH